MTVCVAMRGLGGESDTTQTEPETERTRIAVRTGEAGDDHDGGLAGHAPLPNGLEPANEGRHDPEAHVDKIPGDLGFVVVVGWG